MKFIQSIILSIFLLVSAAFTYSSYHRKKTFFSKEATVYEVLKSLGEPTAKHELDSISTQLIQTGKELITLGYSKNHEGKKSKRISKHFVCTSCHNTEREDPDLDDALNPEKRLQYCKEKKLPFLQGTTLWGIVNRESWYNDDYIQKYGDLVTKARNDLAESTQLCAKECSQGRLLEDWELKAILAYYWSIQIKLNDLELPADFLAKISQTNTEDQKRQLIIDLKALYSQRSSAHFIKGDKEQEIIKNLPNGNPINGKLIYDISCKHCHKPNGVSLMTFNNSKNTKKKFTKHLGSNNHFDLYHITRDGTHPIMGHKAYMPYYPVERMSSQQLKNLVSYLSVIKKK